VKLASKHIAVIGAGINGLVAANYLQRSGHRVSLLERGERVGGACVSAVAKIDGISQDYALEKTEIPNADLDDGTLLYS